MSFFANVELVPGDPILSLTDAYNTDSRTNKVNLGIGIYYDESGCIPLLRAVQQIEQQLAKNPKPRGYLPIDGLPTYIKATQQLLFGVDSPLLAAGRVVTSQTVGGSGALRVGAELLKKVLPHATVAISNPSWENHRALFSAAGFKIEDYTYFDPVTRNVNFTGMLADLAKLQPKTVVLLHGCCHNPTGADLTLDQWKQVAGVLKERQLFPCVDLAYQGFNQGIDADAYAVRLLAEEGISNYVIASSYSKSFSLYSERVGALSIVASNTEQAEAVQSQIKRIIRTIYSSPPAHGAYLVAGVLTSHELR
ncbi:MAG TPA: amino acid aminotransferase, partial [Xylella taiwanensis]